MKKALIRIMFDTRIIQATGNWFEFESASCCTAFLRSVLSLERHEHGQLGFRAYPNAMQCHEPVLNLKYNRGTAHWPWPHRQPGRINSQASGTGVKRGAR